MRGICNWTMLVLLGGCQSPTPSMFTTGGGDVPAQIGMTYRFAFDEAAPGGLPANLVAPLGQWAVAADPAAPSPPNLMRQSGHYGDPDFPRIIVKDLTFGDFTLRVRCRPESGDTDRACGLMFRLRDSDNYYIARANALEDNVNLYHVVHGDRSQFAGKDTRVTAGAWHTLEVTARGTMFTVGWDGTQLFSASDSTFARGKIGLWTKADSVTAFDDLEAKAE